MRLKLLACLASAFSLFDYRVYALWPIPRTLQSGASFLRLSSDFEINVGVKNAPQDLLAAVWRTKVHIETDKLQRLVVGRGSNDSVAIQNAPALFELKVMLNPGSTVQSIAEEAVKPLAERSEGYSLTVPNNGSDAILTADSTLGLFRGLTTFQQLWYDIWDVTYTYQAPIFISDDTPAFPYRGFMLDTARNFFPVNDIKRTLDAMSMVKINTFHWHIVDSQSFPLHIDQFPEVAQHGAYSLEEIYSSADVQGVVSYAGARGIDVLMEIDIPGHTTAIAASHPQHITCNEATPWGGFANEPPAGQLRISSAPTIQFTADLISSVARTLPSSLFSTGGDEINMNCYKTDGQTVAESEKALDVFTQAIHKSLTDLGKSPVVWEEMVLAHKVTLPASTAVLVWISSDHAADVVSKNFKLIHAPSDYFYLDCGGGGWMGNNVAGNSWCDPFKTWQKAYSFDPYARIPSEKQSLVLGGQQLLWTEQSSPENLDSTVWPRAASSAEVFWTGATLPDGTPRNVDAALPRLHDIRYRMVKRGIKAIALQPHWCALRPGACNA